VDCERFHPSGRDPEDYFLLVGRLIEPYLQSTIVLEAFRGLPHRLVVAGDGPALERLRATAPPNVEFTGRVSDARLVELMQGCLAGLSPTRHDFGLTPIEVMACGRPVLAYGAGGARHTVVPGVTGELFEPQTPEAVAEAVEAFDPGAYDAGAIRAHAEGWSAERFRERLVAAVNEVVAA
jgi:glycosyltransferase involved in cell wall biosynthesis